ncbi:MAG: phytanoyl-CoA dioxygenase family protein [bacterium]|nr:phytanoyl-CoA dioxygenase family protein [bacterium]
MAAREDLLDSLQMANFVADGFLRFDALVPARLNAAALAEMESGAVESPKRGPDATLDKAWPRNPGIRAVFSLPEIQGVIHSLVGPNPHFDHHAIHVVPPERGIAQVWHADNILDLRLDFDIQFFYFPHDTPREMGGTMILPGSHYRRVSESDIARYHNFRNQYPIVCKAGTVVVVHHGIWHCAQPNLTRRTRYMFKLRLNPTVPQRLLWDTADRDDPEIGKVLMRDHDWYGNEDRLEIVNRIRFWRFLTGDAQFDVGYFLSRLENQPATGTASAFASVS